MSAMCKKVTVRACVRVCRWKSFFTSKWLSTLSLSSPDTSCLCPTSSLIVQGVGAAVKAALSKNSPGPRFLIRGLFCSDSVRHSWILCWEVVCENHDVNHLGWRLALKCREWDATALINNSGTNQPTKVFQSATSCAHCYVHPPQDDPLWAAVHAFEKFEDLLHKSSDVILSGLLVCLGFRPDLLCHATFLGTTPWVKGLCSVSLIAWKIVRASCDFALQTKRASPIFSFCFFRAVRFKLNQFHAFS